MDAVVGPSGQDHLAKLGLLWEDERAKLPPAVVDAQAAEKEGVGYPRVVARLGADSYAYAERWLARLEEDLDGNELSD